MAGGPRSPYKTNRNKYEDAMNNVVHKEVCRVFLWLYQGVPKYVGDYLDEIPGGKKGLKKDQIAKLNRKEPPTRMDITLLYLLLQRTCGLSKDTDPIWTKPTGSDSSSLEHTLYLIKEERNKLSHEGHTPEAQKMSNDVLDRKLNDLRHRCANLLVEAARRCGRRNEIVALNDKMDTQLQEIRGVTSDKFIMMAKEELKTLRTEMGYEWYQQPLFRRHGQPVTLDNLLQWRASDGTASTFLLVTGEPGVGKSSLCRYLEECWLRPRSDCNDSLQRYQLVLLVLCRDINTSDVVRLLQEELLPETASWCSSVTLNEFICIMPILWVFDGLDEATEEAMRLIASLLSKSQQNITVLATSKPEYGRDFLSRYSNDMRHISVNLCGVDPLKAIMNIVLSRKCNETIARHAKSLMEDFKKLDRRIQQELQNPLKLRLTLEGWESMRTSTLNQVFDLSRLYQKITDTQIESLSESLSKGRMTKDEATRKARKWFLFLCESAFSLIRCRKVFEGIIRKEMLRELADKCDDFGISSSQCLSTFLSCSDSMFSSGNNGYTFYHDTQVHFLAALHLDSVMKESNDLHSDTLRLFNISALQEYSSSQPPLEQFLNVLLFLVSLTSGSVSDDVLKMMIKLLLNAIPLSISHWIWFEVAKKASYENSTMREISGKIPKFWLILDRSVEAARRLLEYSQPNKVLLCVVCNPEELKEFEPLVCRLASLPVVLQLRLRRHTLDLFGKETSDKYLEIICREESPCVLVYFEGHLSDEGYDLLRHPKISDCCEVLKMKVKSPKSLEILCECVRDCESLERIEVVIAMKQIPVTSIKLQATYVTLSLPCMTDETAIDTAKFTARLRQSYHELIVYSMPYSGIKSFLLHLKKKGVAVNRFLGCFEDGVLVSRCIDFGSLPLQYPLENFQQQWNNFRRLAWKIRLA